MLNWTDELLNLMIRKHVERLNPKPKQQTPDQMLQHVRIMNAAMGGTEVTNKG